MAPAVVLDNVSDFPATAAPQPSAKSNAASAHRTLLLAPPSVAAHPELLDRIFESHDRRTTDLQMLDRLALGLVRLPDAAYNVVLLLADADGTRTESQALLGRDIMPKIVAALTPGGRFRSLDGLLGIVDGPEKTEAILAGLVSDGGEGMLKPEASESVSVPLNFRRKAKAAAGATAAAPANSTTATTSNGVTAAPVAAAATVPLNGKRKSLSDEPAKPAGVGFVDFTDDLDAMITGEDELIDEDDLLTEADLARPIQIPPECLPKAGKRRRACKDCTCGLKEKIEAEDRAKRDAADSALNAMKLGADDLAEVDFTVQGKVGSCGNCALGDAFRCDGCPYIGLPAFKPGEEIRLLNNDIQL